MLLSQDVDRVRKFLVRYEMFKLSLDVPGDILECGVFKGVGFMYWLKLLAIHEPASIKRVVGFDTFTSFADSLQSYERKGVDEYVKEANFAGASPNELKGRAAAMGCEKRVELVSGDLVKTAREYSETNPGFRISLLNLDVDTYSGTKAVLEAFYPHVSRRGIIILDEYALRGWGESDAVDELFRDKSVQVTAVPNSTKPTAYIVKP